MPETTEQKLARLEGSIETLATGLELAIKDLEAEKGKTRALTAAVKDALSMVDVHSKALVMLANHVNPMVKNPGQRMDFRFDHIARKLHL